jgi:hypothetical protein
VVLLDHLPGWRRLYTDDIAAVHVRQQAPPARADARPAAGRNYQLCRRSAIAAPTANLQQISP